MILQPEWVRSTVQSLETSATVKVPLRVAVVGAGNRGTLYASYGLRHPERMQVVAVVDPDPRRRSVMSQNHGVTSAMQLADYQQLAAHRDMIDAVVNTTMDELHYESTMYLLHNGFDVLLEKPIAPTEAQVRHLIHEARSLDRMVMVCHVLRYAPFYEKIKELIDVGALGQVMNIHTSEHVNYHHMVTAFVRGRWNRAATSNPMIVAKCCHDLDLLAWFMENDRPVRVASFGRLSHYQPGKAPAGASERCLSGCSVEPQCLYSAKRMYVDHEHWGHHVWNSRSERHSLTQEQKIALLQTSSPYGRCVWKCDNDVMDHQNVAIEFASGATASHDMLCTSAKATRKIHVTGSQGEIEGDLSESSLLLRRYAPDRPGGYRQEAFSVRPDDSGLPSHGGGDEFLIRDFVASLLGNRSAARTRLDASLDGHLIAFAAERARREGRVVEIAP